MATSPLYEIPVRRIDGTPSRLADFSGKALLIVNVASECGLTPQYEGLQKLYETYREKGLEILGFPANEFGAQEPGTNEEIQGFCTKNYGVEFPMFEKIVVKGDDIHPLYRALTEEREEAENFGDDAFEKKLASFGIEQDGPGAILWNFEKFLLGRDGTIVGRFSPGVEPEHPEFVQAIERALG